MKDNWNLSYIMKNSKRLTTFMELKAKSDLSSSECVSGFKMKFIQGSIVGYATTGGKFFCTYGKVLEGGTMRLEFNSQVDFVNARKPCFFGVKLDAGMM
jgi:hypothetical protein